MNARIRLFNVAATAIAVAAGLITLLAYVVRLPLLLSVQLGLLGLVSVLAAWAVLAGALNLLIVHARKFVNQSPGWHYSLFVILGFAAVILINLLSPIAGWGSGASSTGNRYLLVLVSAGGASVAALIAFFLVFAGYRLLRGRVTPMRVAFVVAAVLALLALAPWPAGTPNPDVAGVSLRDLLRTVTQLPALAGARGLLLGIALGVTATGLRVVLGLDRPYGE